MNICYALESIHSSDNQQKVVWQQGPKLSKLTVQLTD